jgi:very-short-patch-repair endonuclease
MEEDIENRLDDFMQSLKGQIQCQLNVCESPIERILLLEFIKRTLEPFSSGTLEMAIMKDLYRPDKRNTFIHPSFPDLDERIPIGVYWQEEGLKGEKIHYIIPQYLFNDSYFDSQTNVTKHINYRLDFAYFAEGRYSDLQIKIAIECDGHNFHEKTKEQAQRDKEKDQRLQSRGWHIARFTGSEIYNNPASIVDRIESLQANIDVELCRKINTDPNLP